MGLTLVRLIKTKICTWVHNWHSFLLCYVWEVWLISSSVHKSYSGNQNDMLVLVLGVCCTLHGPVCVCCRKSWELLLLSYSVMALSLCNGVTVTWNRRILNVFLVITCMVCWLYFLPVDSRIHCLSHLRFFSFQWCVCMRVCTRARVCVAYHVQCAWIDVQCCEAREVRHTQRHGGKEGKAEEISIWIIFL